MIHVAVFLFAVIIDNKWWMKTTSIEGRIITVIYSITLAKLNWSKILNDQ